LLASGHCDLVIEADLEPWDYIPLIAVVTGAGGVIADWEGRPLGLHSDGNVIAAVTPNLLREALSVLGQDS
jgi:fructose-1,6-bisphosphatase/inositol monophosphatase family enzyme